MIYVAPNGQLYYEQRVFTKACFLIDGIGITELWVDAYQLNLQNGVEPLFPADICSPFPFKVTEHIHGKDKEFVEKGGGFRLDFLVRY